MADALSFARRLAGAAVLAGAGLVVAVAGITLAGSNVPDPLSAVANALVFGQPAAVAFIGLRRDSPAMLVAAFAQSIPLMVYSVIGVLFMIPGILYLIAYGRWPTVRRGVWSPLLGVVAFIMSVLAMIAPLSRQNPRCAPTADGSACSSNTVTAAETLLTLLVVAAGIGLVSYLGAMRRREEPDLSP